MQLFVCRDQVGLRTVMFVYRMLISSTLPGAQHGRPLSEVKYRSVSHTITVLLDIVIRWCRVWNSFHIGTIHKREF